MLCKPDERNEILLLTTHFSSCPAQLEKIGGIVKIVEVGVWHILCSPGLVVLFHEDECHLDCSNFPLGHLLNSILVEKLSQDYAMLPPGDVEAADELATLRTLDRSVQ